MAKYLIEYTIGTGRKKQSFCDQYTADNVRQAKTFFCYDNCCDEPEIISISLMENGVGAVIPESEWK